MTRLPCSPLLLRRFAAAGAAGCLGSYGVDLVTKIMVYAIFALSLGCWSAPPGWCASEPGGVLRHRRLCGGVLSPPSGRRRCAWLLPASMVAAALYALAVGALSLRTKGVYFIMVTLAFAQMAYYVVHDTPLGGGTDGIYPT